MLYLSEQYSVFLRLRREMFLKDKVHRFADSVPLTAQSRSSVAIRALTGITAMPLEPAECIFLGVAMAIYSTLIPRELHSKFIGNQSRTKKRHPSKGNMEILYTLPYQSFQKTDIFRTERSVGKKHGLHSPNSKPG